MENQRPLISIIIPVYNREGVVGRTLYSVLQQTYRPVQVVLVDNDSTDGSLAVLNRYRQEHDAAGFAVDVASEPVHTAGAARNRGLQLARGEWVMFFDSDDVMLPTLVESYVQAINTHSPDMVLTKALVRNLDGSEQVLPWFGSDFIENHIVHCLASTQRFIARRELLDRVGGWNPSLVGWNDWELGTRLLLQQPRVATVTDAIRVVVIASGEASITGTSLSAKAGHWERSLDAVDASVQASSHPLKRKLADLVAYRRINLAALYCREGRPDLAQPLQQAVSQHFGGRLLPRLLMKALLWWTKTGHRGAGRIAQKLL